MATIEQHKAHAYPIEEARKKAENLAEELKAKLNLEWAWRGDTIDFEAKSGSAKGVKGMVESRVKDKLAAL
jgi:hypothetical protein